jgi:hypothetical protein
VVAIAAVVGSAAIFFSRACQIVTADDATG